MVTVKETIFLVNQYIYIKKYKGNYLTADTNTEYKINYIDPIMTKNKYNNYYEKYAILDNGNKQLLYIYDCYTKKYDFFAEKVPYYKIWCCF